MKTIVVHHPQHGAAGPSLLEQSAPAPPSPQGHQLCIAVQAVSVNPVPLATNDTGLRQLT